MKMTPQDPTSRGALDGEGKSFVQKSWQGFGQVCRHGFLTCFKARIFIYIYNTYLFSLIFTVLVYLYEWMVAVVQKFLLPETAIFCQKIIYFSETSPSPQKTFAAPYRISGVCYSFTLKHLRFALGIGPCSPSSASSDTSTPEL